MRAETSQRLLRWVLIVLVLGVIAFAWLGTRCECALGRHYEATALDPADCPVHGRMVP